MTILIVNGGKVAVHPRFRNREAQGENYKQDINAIMNESRSAIDFCLP
jgi:hypothetical protein